MAAYIASPTLSSPSQYAPTFHGHGQSISYRQGYSHFHHHHHHQRNAPSFSLAPSTSTGSDVAGGGGGGASFAPLRSALARRAQASECVQPPTRTGSDGTQQTHHQPPPIAPPQSASYRGNANAAAAAGRWDSPASLRTHELLSESSCSIPTLSHITFAPAGQSGNLANTQTAAASASASGSASARYASHVRSEQGRSTLSAADDQTAGLGVRAGAGGGGGVGGGLVDIDKQYEYGRLLRKASQSFKGSGGVYGAVGSGARSGSSGGESKAKPVLESPYQESRSHSRSSTLHHQARMSYSAAHTHGHAQGQGQGQKRCTFSLSPSPSETQSQRSKGSTPRQCKRPSVGSLHIQHQVQSLMLPSDGYGQSYAHEGEADYGGAPRSNTDMGNAMANASADAHGDKHRSTASTATYRPSPEQRYARSPEEAASVYSPAANARRVSQYGANHGHPAAFWSQGTAAARERTQGDDAEGRLGLGMGLGFAGAAKREDGNRPSSYLRSGPRLTKYADFDFAALDSAADDITSALSLGHAGAGAGASTGAQGAGKSGKGAGRSILGAWTVGTSSNNGAGRKGKAEPQSFLDLGDEREWKAASAKAAKAADAVSVGTSGTGSSGGTAGVTAVAAAAGGLAGFGRGATRMMGVAGKWVMGGTAAVAGHANANAGGAGGMEAEEDELHSFFDGYSSRKPSSGGINKKSNNARERDRGQLRGNAPSTATATGTSTSTHLPVSTSMTLSPSLSTDSRWSIGTTRRAHAERLLPSSAIRSDSRTLLQGFSLATGLDLDSRGGESVSVSKGGGGGGRGELLEFGGRLDVSGLGHRSDNLTGRAERAISVGTVLGQETQLGGLYATNGTAPIDSEGSLVSASSAASGSVSASASMSGSESESGSGANTASQSAMSDRIITPDLSVAYSGASEYMSESDAATAPAPAPAPVRAFQPYADSAASRSRDAATAALKGLGSPLMPVPDVHAEHGGITHPTYLSTRTHTYTHAQTGVAGAAAIETESGNLKTPDRQPFASGSPGFGLISLEAAQERERERSRSGQTTVVPTSISVSVSASAQGQRHTPRASTSTTHTARTTATHTTTAATGTGKMPGPRGSTSTIAQKIKSKKSLIALIKSATTFGTSSTSTAPTGAGTGPGVSVSVSGNTGPRERGAKGTPGVPVPVLPAAYARRADGASIKSLIGEPIPLIHLSEAAQLQDDGTPRAYGNGGTANDEDVEEVDDFRADSMHERSTAYLSPAPAPPATSASGGGQSQLSVQPKLELRPVSMNFAHVMPEGYLVMDYADGYPDAVDVHVVGGSAGDVHAISSGRDEAADRDEDVSSVLTAPSSASLSTSSSSYAPILDLSGITTTTTSNNGQAPPHGNGRSVESLQRELSNMSKLHQMQLSELSSQLREAKDELASLRAEHLDVLEELAETAAMAAAAMTKQQQQYAGAGAGRGGGGGGIGGGWEPKEGGCAICGCTCAMHRRSDGGRTVERRDRKGGDEEAMVVSENLMGSPSTRRLHAGRNASVSTRRAAAGGAVGAAVGRSSSGHQSNKSYGQSGGVTPGRTRSGTVKSAKSSANTSSGQVSGKRDRNAVYPALAAPPSTSPATGTGDGDNRASPIGEGYRKTGVMDRGRVKTGGARGFRTGSLYQWE